MNHFQEWASFALVVFPPVPSHHIWVMFDFLPAVLVAVPLDISAVLLRLASFEGDFNFDGHHGGRGGFSIPLMQGCSPL